MEEGEFTEAREDTAALYLDYEEVELEDNGEIDDNTQELWRKKEHYLLVLLANHCLKFLDRVSYLKCQEKITWKIILAQILTF